jgi:hypothetical protein
MGVWLAGTVFSAVGAAENFYTIDRLLENSGNSVFQAAMTQLGSPLGREVLRYLSSELNRLYFQWWNIAQMAVLVLVLWLVRPLPHSRRALGGVIAMLVIVMFLTLALTPPIVSVGRALDFVPRDPPPPQLRTFGLLHAAFSVFTLINLVLGTLVTLWIQKGSEQSEEDESAETHFRKPPPRFAQR